jgi:hypothetical protein
LASFWEEIGFDDEDYSQGTILRPSQEWIGDCISFCRIYYINLLLKQQERTRFKTNATRNKKKASKQTNATGRQDLDSTTVTSLSLILLSYS